MKFLALWCDRFGSYLEISLSNWFIEPRLTIAETLTKSKIGKGTLKKGISRAWVSLESHNGVVFLFSSGNQYFKFWRIQPLLKLASIAKTRQWAICICCHWHKFHGLRNRAPIFLPSSVFAEKPWADEKVKAHFLRSEPLKKSFVARFHSSCFETTFFSRETEVGFEQTSVFWSQNTFQGKRYSSASVRPFGIN